MAENRVMTFKGASVEDVVLIGKKAHILSSLYNAGVPVPPGFIITTNAYFDFITKTGLKAKIINLISCLDDAKVQDISKQIQKHIMDQEMPLEMIEEITELYTSAFISKTDTEDLIQFESQPFVAVRISYTREKKDVFFDYSPHFLNVKGKDKLIRIIKTCWASIFDTEAILHRQKNNIDHLGISIAIIVQEMISPKASGIIKTVDPGHSKSMLIEAIKGFSDPFLKGEMRADTFIVDRNTAQQGSSRSNGQAWGYFLKDNKLVRLDIPAQEQNVKSLDTMVIDQLAQVALEVENYFEWPQRIEFIVSDSVYVIESSTLDVSRYDPVDLAQEESDPESDIIDVDESEDYEDYAKAKEQKDDVLIEYYEEERVGKESLFDNFQGDIEVPEYDPGIQDSDLKTEIIDVFRKYMVINPNIKEALELLKNDVLKIIDEH